MSPAGDAAPTIEEHDELSHTLVAAAIDLLADEGSAALTVRSLAARAGCSTMGVYSRFGGKDGVVDAVFAEGFRRLTEAMRNVTTTDDPVADLERCGRAYRAFAIANPTHYRVMFGEAVPGFHASEASILIAHESLGLLEFRVARCLDAGQFDPSYGTPEDLAHSFWAASHGLVSLELSGMGREPATQRDERFDRTQRALVRGVSTAIASAPPPSSSPS